MKRCCTSFMAAIHLKSAAVKQCPMHCDLSLCAVCLQHRSRSTLKKAHYCIAETMRPSTDEDPGDFMRHIVLTTPKRTGDIRELADTLGWWFNMLKRRTAWRSHVRACMGVFEVVGNARDGWGWHVHCLTIGSWWQNQCKIVDVVDERMLRPLCDDTSHFIGPLPKLEDYGTVFTRPARPSYDECDCIKRVSSHSGRRNAPRERCLMQEWYQVTGGEAHIIHISAAGENHRNGKSNAIAEAVKYVVKTIELDAPSIIDFQTGMTGFQRVRWSGEWYGMQPPDDDLEPRVMVCPDDLWRFSTGTIGELFGRLNSSDPLVTEAAQAAGWKLIPFEGPLKEGRARPPPEVSLHQAFAVTAVEHLEQASNDLDTKTKTYFAGNPDRLLAFTVGDVPF